MGKTQERYHELLFGCGLGKFFLYTLTLPWILGKLIKSILKIGKKLNIDSQKNLAS